MDRSKTAFLTQSSQNESTVSGVNAAEEINQLRQQAAVETVKSEEVEKVEAKTEETVRQSYQEEIYENFEQIQSSRQQNVEQVILYVFSLFVRLIYVCLYINVIKYHLFNKNILYPFSSTSEVGANFAPFNGILYIFHRSEE